MDERVIRAARSLMMRYQTISVKKVQSVQLANANSSLYTITHMLTGKGKSDTCKLCIAASSVAGSSVYREMCAECIYNKPFGTSIDLLCIEHDTYKAITKASNALELVAAFRARAKFIRNILKQIEANDCP